MVGICGYRKIINISVLQYDIMRSYCYHHEILFFFNHSNLQLIQMLIVTFNTAERIRVSTYIYQNGLNIMFSCKPKSMKHLLQFFPNDIVVVMTLLGCG